MRLHRAAREYQRVTLWFEHDRLDQFVLLRCLAFFAEHGAPPQLELVTANDFPGGKRFLGLGQLPPEALKLLWERRRRVTREELDFARAAWRMVQAPDPRELAALARHGTPLLPYLAVSLHRHLQELPALRDGLGLTQRLLLQTLAANGTQRAGKLVEQAMKVDPLPGLGDLVYEQFLREMGALPEPLVLRSNIHAAYEWHRDDVTLTDLGRAVLEGQVNWLDLPGPERWVGGVCVRAGQTNWHWNEAAGEVIPATRISTSSIVP